MLAQEKDFCFRSNSLYLAGGFQSIYAWHGNIEDHDVWLNLLSLNHRFRAIRSITNNRKVWFRAKQSAYGFACNLVVIHDDNVCALTHYRSLSSAVTEFENRAADRFVGRVYG